MVGGMTRPSLRTAIDRKCKECIYDPLAPGAWREQVEACSSSNCALHAVRPLSIKSKKTRNVARVVRSAPLGSVTAETPTCGGEIALNAPIIAERRER